MMQMCAISSDHNGFVRHVRASMFKSRPCTQASRGLCLDMRYYFPFSEHELSVELCVRSLDHIQALSALICIFYCIFFFFRFNAQDLERPIQKLRKDMCYSPARVPFVPSTGQVARAYDPFRSQPDLATPLMTHCTSPSVLVRLPNRTRGDSCIKRA